MKGCEIMYWDDDCYFGGYEGPSSLDPCDLGWPDEEPEPKSDKERILNLEKIVEELQRKLKGR